MTTPARALKSTVCALALSVAFGLCAAPALAAGPTVDWPSYGGDAGGTKYSTLKQITKSNVKKLKEAWRFEVPAGGLQFQPLIVGRVMYVATTDKRLVALDAASGKVMWERKGLEFTGRTRGLTWWQSGNEKRLIAAGGSNIYAINPDNGESITSFGKNGIIDLRENLRGDDPTKHFVNHGSPVNLYKDIFITGGGVAEVSPASPGDVRGWDVRTGKLLWTFHTIPHPGEFGYDTWPADAYQKLGGANNWVGGVVDEKRGIVFVPTGSAADDFAGPERLGNNLFANSLIALDATTGKRLWHFQATHHDLWDSDFAAPPVLLTIKRNGKMIDAVAATNKFGFVYTFDRVTGEPLFPITEMPAPPAAIPGDVASPTQPVPSLPAPLGRQTLSADQLTTRTPEAAAWALEKFKTFAVSDKLFLPPQLNKETVVSPGFSGGVEWGGMAVDPKGVMYVNTEHVVWATAVTERGPNEAAPPSGGFRSKYGFSGYHKFVDADGYPASAAPWGKLNAIDMNSGKYLWSIPFGEYPELVAKGLKDTGSESYGGPVVTASGLLFIGATIYDRKLRAFDAAKGKVLWETVLPYAGTATPSTYMVDGTQYVAIAASGQRDRNGPKGAAYIAFSLAK